VPLLYVEPFEGVSAYLKGYGKISMSHAYHGEHSVAAYMGLLNKKAFDEINRVTGMDPERALENWKPLVRLGWYVLYGGPRYEALRNPDHGRIQAVKRFLKERLIIADPGVGRELFEKNLASTVKLIMEFTNRN
jgi:hypothetical protein